MPARSVRVVCFVPSLDLPTFYLPNAISCLLQLGPRNTHGCEQFFLSRFPSRAAFMFLINRPYAQRHQGRERWGELPGVRPSSPPSPHACRASGAPLLHRGKHSSVEVRRWILAFQRLFQLFFKGCHLSPFTLPLTSGDTPFSPEATRVPDQAEFSQLQRNITSAVNRSSGSL